MLLFCLIWGFPFAQLLEFQLETKNVAKEWSRRFIEKLIASSNYPLMATIINNPKYPFRDKYLDWCSSLTSIGLYKILDDLKENQKLLREILSVECLDSSLNCRLLYNRRIASTSIQLFESVSLEPARLFGIIPIYVHKVINETNRKRLILHSFCSAPWLRSYHFYSSEIWRLLGVKCLSALLVSTRRNRNEILLSVFQAFRFKFSDSSKKLFLKIVVLLALKIRLTRSTFLAQAVSLLKEHILFLPESLPPTDQWGQLSRQILVLLNAASFPGFTSNSSFSAILRSCHQRLRDDPGADAQWLLSFAYVLRRYPTSVLSTASIDLLVNWFFVKNPSADEVCQLYELFNDNSFKPVFHQNLHKDEELFELVFEQCPEIALPTELPLKMKVNRFLRSKRSLNSQSEIYYFSFQFSTEFPRINSYLMREWRVIMSHYFIFVQTGDDESFSGPEIISFWFEGFMKAEIYHHVIEFACGKPVIIPSLLMPSRLAYNLGVLLVRSIVYNQSWPFYLSKAYLEGNSNELYHRDLTDNYDASVLDACEVPFDCTVTELESELRYSWNFYEMDRAIDDELLNDCSNIQKSHFIDGIMETFDNRLKLSEIVQVFGNKLK
jgi:hypothetical protein